MGPIGFLEKIRDLFRKVLSVSVENEDVEKSGPVTQFLESRFDCSALALVHGVLDYLHPGLPSLRFGPVGGTVGHDMDVASGDQSGDRLDAVFDHQLFIVRRNQHRDVPHGHRETGTVPVVPQLPADTYIGTLNIQAQATP